jgi:O-antigen/teichoic acid export membrane protein
MTRFISAVVFVLLVLASSTSAFAADDGRPLVLPVLQAASADRPRALPALYVGFATLQVFDSYSTMRALRQGGRELNPIVSPIVNQPIMFLSMKAASTAASIFYAERLWRGHHRTHAVVLMVAVNVVMGAVGAHNASVLSGR